MQPPKYAKVLIQAAANVIWAVDGTSGNRWQPNARTPLALPTERRPLPCSNFFAAPHSRPSLPLMPLQCSWCCSSPPEGSCSSLCGQPLSLCIRAVQPAYSACVGCVSRLCVRAKRMAACAIAGAAAPRARSLETACAAGHARARAPPAPYPAAAQRHAQLPLLPPVPAPALRSGAARPPAAAPVPAARRRPAAAAQSWQTCRIAAPAPAHVGWAGGMWRALVAFVCSCAAIASMPACSTGICLYMCVGRRGRRDGCLYGGEGG